MDWKTFFVEMTGTLVWPSVVAYVLFLLKDEIVTLTQRVQSIGLQTGVGSFDVGLTKAEADSKNIDWTLDSKIELPEPIRKIARLEPSAAVLMAWKYLYRDLSGFYKERFKGHRKVGVSVTEMIDTLTDENDIDPAFASVLKDLWRLRNVAVHAIDHQISEEKSLEYAQLCISMGKSLQQALD